MTMSAHPALPSYSMNRPSFPWMYERSLVPTLFSPWAEELLDRGELRPGGAAIDVACGTGIVARLARQRLGPTSRVVGIDVSGPMLSVARELEPGVEWIEGDAMALPVADDERFDRVMCQQGLQFFVDRQAAVRELRRALAPDGLLLLSVWCGAAEMPLFDELQRVAERHLGPIHDQRYAFGNREALVALLAEAGFHEIDAAPASLVHRFPDAEDLIRMNAMALVGMSGKALTEEERDSAVDTIVADSAAAVRAFADGSALVGEMRANVVVAR
jgi:ubiquinone/menaquinone biosynthesis C-methylase UbiE